MIKSVFPTVVCYYIVPAAVARYYKQNIPVYSECADDGALVMFPDRYQASLNLSLESAD